MRDKLTIAILIIFFLSFIVLALFFYKGYYKSELDFCLDTGCCSEGLIINTEYGKIEINKQNCEKYRWSWDEEKCRCSLK